MKNFKYIKNYEGLYSVNEYGDIYSHKSKIILKVSYTFDGYKKLLLYKNGVRKTFRINRLVAEAFIPNLENKPQVNHKDGNKNNNHVSNLEWVTNQENVIHAYKNGLAKMTESTKNKISKNNAKARSKKVACIDITTNKVIKEYLSATDGAKDVKGTVQNITKICRTGKGTCKGFKWAYI